MYSYPQYDIFCLYLVLILFGIKHFIFTGTNGDATVEIKFFGSSLWQSGEVDGETLYIDGLKAPAIVHDGGLLITANDGVKVGLPAMVI